MSNQAARSINMGLGAWMAISAFLWIHTQLQFDNAWVVGLLAVVIALLGFMAPTMRFVNALLAVWLFVSSWVLPQTNQTTLWNNFVVSMLMLIFSFSTLPGRQPPIRTRPL